MTPDQQIIFTYIIIFAAILTPIALDILGSILNNHKKKISKLLLIVGGSWLGLYAVFFFISLFANMLQLP